MPALDDDREELLAQEIAKGVSQAVAYVNAGFPAKDNKVAAAACSRLLRNRSHITERIGELRALGRTVLANSEFEATIEGLTRAFLEDRAQAKQLGQVSAGIAALAHIAKMHGRMADTVKLQGDAENPIQTVTRIELVAPAAHDNPQN